jgi:serine/threonine protein kinase
VCVRLGQCSDLKPSNLLVDANGRIKVCDFGLSCVKEKGEKVTDKDSRGTPLWMSPEALMGRPLDEKADIYSFAIVLWEIGTYSYCLCRLSLTLSLSGPLALLYQPLSISRSMMPRPKRSNAKSASKTVVLHWPSLHRFQIYGMLRRAISEQYYVHWLSWF